MDEKVYVLFGCDQWKSAESMRMICASAHPDRIMDAIEGEVEAGDMSFFFGNGDASESLPAFRKFREEGQELRFANSYLEYGHLEIVEDGEVL